MCDYEPDLNTRPNDGKCDREGNFVIGSYNNNHRQDEKNIAGMWRLSKDDKSLTEIMDYRFRCSNTIAFDQTGTKIYFCDTVSEAPPCPHPPIPPNPSQSIEKCPLKGLGFRV